MARSQVIAGIVAVIVSWYGMMAVHEAGHCLGALATGATIEAVEIPLAGFSRTDFSGGASPVLVVWAGPLLGAALPLVLLLLRPARRRTRHCLLFFAGFCLLANGIYIGLGAFLRTGDCQQLLQDGSPLWSLVCFGLVATGAGLYAWHRLGPLQSWFALADKPGVDSSLSR